MFACFPRTWTLWTINFCEEELQAYEAASVAWWQRCIIEGNPPAAIRGDDILEWLEAAYPNRADETGEVHAGDVADDLLLSQRATIGREISALTKKKAKIDTALKLRMGKENLRSIECCNYTAVYTRGTRDAFDGAAFKQDHPALYQQYCETVPTGRLTVKKVRKT